MRADKPLSISVSSIKRFDYTMLSRKLQAFFCTLLRFSPQNAAYALGTPPLSFISSMKILAVTNASSNALWWRKVKPK